MARGKKNSSITPMLLIGGAIAAVYFLTQKATLTASTAFGNISIPAADLGTAANAASQLGINVGGGS